MRGNLRLSAGQRLFDQWLKPIVLIPGEDPETVRLGLPSAFMTNWVRSHYADRLAMEFRAVLPAVRTVAIETVDARATRALAAAPAAESPAPAIDQAAAAPRSEGRPNLDSRFTFDRFVVDTSNRVAFNAAR
ncbi:MAG: DnaA N-terminal domain-containing protein, partial [Sphingomonas sp.]